MTNVSIEVDYVFENQLLLESTEIAEWGALSTSIVLRTNYQLGAGSADQSMYLPPPNCYSSL